MKEFIIPTLKIIAPIGVALIVFAQGLKVSPCSVSASENGLSVKAQASSKCRTRWPARNSRSISKPSQGAPTLERLTIPFRS
jgi:hypothetical protein